MKKHEYEAPKFEFQELQLVERVANHVGAQEKFGLIQMIMEIMTK